MTTTNSQTLYKFTKYQFTDLDNDEIDKLGTKDKISAYQTFFETQRKENSVFKRMRAKEILKKETNDYKLKQKSLRPSSLQPDKEFVSTCARGEFFTRQGLIVEPDGRNVYIQKTKSEVAHRMETTKKPWNYIPKDGDILDSEVKYQEMATKGLTQTLKIAEEKGLKPDFNAFYNTSYENRLQGHKKSRNEHSPGVMEKRNWQYSTRPNEFLGGKKIDSKLINSDWPKDEILMNRRPIFKNNKRDGELFGEVRLPAQKKVSPTIIDEASSLERPDQTSTKRSLFEN
eukprot:TRINITY_DN24616_c0_g1_i2.p1 TRINITY_DN24616_c0_g1~~TRINITY_DN24616_c0_g1_i2.p1  ORF type:complete len:286 (+),score=56.16 TRINITY_DN24616_c0_g1_i2:120-977(+)